MGDLLFRALIFDTPQPGVVLETRPSGKPRYGTTEKRMEYKVWAKDTQEYEWVDEMMIGINWITVDKLLTILA